MSPDLVLHMMCLYDRIDVDNRKFCVRAELRINPNNEIEFLKNVG